MLIYCGYRHLMLLEIASLSFLPAVLRSSSSYLVVGTNHRCGQPCLQQSRSCFGCFGKDTVITEVDEPSKREKVQGQIRKKPSISDDFWSSSAGEMDNSVFQPQRSISSISASNQPLDPSGSASNPSEFVNQGLLLWNQTRQQWLANKRSERRTELRESTISWNATYDSLLGTNKPFPRPIPLPEMVDFLVDIWDQEGLYD